MNILDRRIAYLTRACGLLRGDFTIAPPDTPPEACSTTETVEPDDLNRWPARFLTAIAQEEDAAFVRRYAQLFVTDPVDKPPLVGMFDRLVDVPSLAAYDGVLGRQLDATDVIHIGDLMAVNRQQGGDPVLLTMTDIHPALAVSRWWLVTNTQQYRRFEPWLRLLRTLGTEDFDPLTLQCRLLELRERLRETQLEAERAQAAQSAEFEQRLQAALQKKEHEVADIWRAKDADIANLTARLTEREQALQTTEHALQAERTELMECRQRLAGLEAQLSEAETERRQLEARLNETETERRQVEAHLQNVLTSRSWRLTAPLRRLLGGR